jgi:hypothetical protein
MLILEEKRGIGLSSFLLPDQCLFFRLIKMASGAPMQTKNNIIVMVENSGTTG